MVFDLAPHFDFLFVEGEFGTGKPDVRVYETALRAIDRLPRETWMIGDDLHLDVAAPQRLGITGIWVDAWGTGLADDAPAKPDLVIRSIAELPRAIPHELEVVAYDSRWPVAFAEERSRLESALRDFAVEIQHIGSTSVSGLRAKPIIDIAIGIAEYPWPEAPIRAISALGYEHRGEYGIPRRHYFVKGYPRSHHVHAFEVDQPRYHDHLLFRDYLRAHPDAARRYDALKLTLVRGSGGNREAYQDGKASFIEEIVARARAGR